MTKVVRIERGNGKTTETLAVDLSQPPPPEGWRRDGGSIAGNDACFIEDLLVRGLDSGDAVGMFCLTTGARRQDLTHEQDTAGIVDRCRKHGITVEPGAIIDAEGPPGCDAIVRTFRNWRMSGEGCSWGSSSIDFMTTEDGRTVCNVCGQEARPGSSER